jgi:hypothetical protein
MLALNGSEQPWFFEHPMNGVFLRNFLGTGMPFQFGVADLGAA